jgi:hypothetical protein
VADGGSEDDTIELASKYPKVKIRNYPVKVACKNGILRNPDGPHIQFLVDWAREEGADWIVHQDCDQRPNKLLKEGIRDILAISNKDFIMVTQIFVWGKDTYFPALSGGLHHWMQGLWAWRMNAGIKIIDKMPHYEFGFSEDRPINFNNIPDRCQKILPPYCFLHFGWETEEKTKAHVKYYRESGLIPNMAYPTNFGGETQLLEDWMVE